MDSLPPTTISFSCSTSVAAVWPAMSQLPKSWLVPDSTGPTTAYLDLSHDFDLVVVSGQLKSIFFFFLFSNLIFIHSVCRVVLLWSSPVQSGVSNLMQLGFLSHTPVCTGATQCQRANENILIF